MNTSAQYAFQRFAILLSEIELSSFTGSLLCRSTAQTCKLYFRNGQLLHAVSDTQIGEEALYEMLGWGTGTLTFTREALTANRSLDDSQLKLFRDTVKLFQDRGVFEKAAATPTVNSPTPATTSRAELASASKEVAPVSNTAQSSGSSPYSLETNLLLPPGTRQEQIEGLLGQVSFEEQLEFLAGLRFTGCAYYQRASQQHRDEFGLVLLADGSVTDMLYVNGHTGERQQGLAALQNLGRLNLKPEVYKVKARVLKAYRGLVACARSIPNLKVDQANFVKLLQFFKQARYDGVILLYLDTLKLHYFFLIEGGTQVGVFGPTSQSGQLQPLAMPIALPASDVQARMTGMIAAPSVLLNWKTHSVSPRVAIKPTELIVPNATPESVSANGMEAAKMDWSALFKSSAVPNTSAISSASSQKSKVAQPSNVDEDNPYDF